MMKPLYQTADGIGERYPLTLSNLLDGTIGGQRQFQAFQHLSQELSALLCQTKIRKQGATFRALLHYTPELLSGTKTHEDHDIN